MTEYTAEASLNTPGDYVSNSPPLLMPAFELNNTAENDNSPCMVKASGSEIFPYSETLETINTIIPERIENGALLPVFYTMVYLGPEINSVFDPAELICGLNLGMYKIADKLAFLAQITKNQNQIMPYTTLIMQGLSNQIILNANDKGIVCDYIPYDSYDDMIGISPNYIVYILAAKQDMGHFVYNLVMCKATKANVTARMFHRNFE